MKPWLPVLVENLGQDPVLALTTVRNLARAAVLDGEGRLLAGSLGPAGFTEQAGEEARAMSPGECRLVGGPPGGLTLERLDGADERRAEFWRNALEHQQGAWASWLLTMPSLEEGSLKLSRHLLSAFGPWTTPRLPEEVRDQWSLLPLRAGLGRLFIFGDDDLARETAALAGRTGLTVTWITARDQSGPELDEAELWGDFELLTVDGWARVDEPRLEELGVIEGVRALVTAPEAGLLEQLAARRPAYLAASGEGGEAGGLFANPVTTTQKALGLIAEMLR